MSFKDNSEVNGIDATHTCTKILQDTHTCWKTKGMTETGIISWSRITEKTRCSMVWKGYINNNDHGYLEMLQSSHAVVKDLATLQKGISSDGRVWKHYTKNIVHNGQQSGNVTKKTRFPVVKDLHHYPKKMVCNGQDFGNITQRTWFTMVMGLETKQGKGSQWLRPGLETMDKVPSGQGSGNISQRTRFPVVKGLETFHKWQGSQWSRVWKHFTKDKVPSGQGSGNITQRTMFTVTNSKVYSGQVYNLETFKKTKFLV